MAKPYAMDLRERVVARVEAGETVRAVAAAFDVSVSAVVKWSQRYRATGSAAPAQFGGWRRPILEPHAALWAFVHGQGLSFKKNRVRC